MSDWLTPPLLTLLIKGVWLTIVLTLITNLLSLGSGLFIGSLRLWGKGWATTGSTLFIETFRNIPALVLIIFWAFAFPNAFPVETRKVLFFDNPLIDAAGSITGLSVPWYALAAGTLGLIVVSGVSFMIPRIGVAASITLIIAGQLVISGHTVKGHVSNILSKLHLADRTQAAVYAWQKGIVRRS